MAVRIFNTLTKREEEFRPIEDKRVKMYVCGVTVYDDIHMGHARSIIVFDMIAKYLRYRGYNVTHLTNFTDVGRQDHQPRQRDGHGPLGPVQNVH